MGLVAGRVLFQEEPSVNGQAVLAKLSYTGDMPVGTISPPTVATAAARPAPASTATATVARPATAAVTAPAKPVEAIPVAMQSTNAGAANSADKKPVTLDDLRYLIPARQ